MIVNSRWKRPRFSIVRTENCAFWSGILPAQLHHFSSVPEALRALALVIFKIQKGKIDFVFSDLWGNYGKDKAMPGGLQHVMSFLPENFRAKWKPVRPHKRKKATKKTSLRISKKIKKRYEANKTRPKV